MKQTNRGLTLIEMILAAVVFSVAIVVLFRAFTTNRRYSLASRDRTAAQLLASNLIEEIRAHPFGVPARSDWPPDNPPSANWQSGAYPEVERIPVYVEGRPQMMLFHRRLSYEGSLVGAGKQNFDTVTVTISWQDPGDERIKTLSARMETRPR